MKKVLFIILASIMSFGNAQAIDLSSFTIGVGANNSVFAATGKEDNYNESGGGLVSTSEHGAFAESYASIFGEVNLTDTVSLGASFQGGFDTPTNVNERGAGDAAGKTDATSTVSVSFEQYMQYYVKMNVPLGGTFVKLGYVTVDAETNEKQASGNSYPDAELEGVMVSIGYEHDAGEVGVRLELQGHSFDDISVDNGKATTANYNKITISDMIGASATLSVVKTF